MEHILLIVHLFAYCITFFSEVLASKEIPSTIRQTNASLAKMNDLTCYRCSTMNADENERCQNISLVNQYTPSNPPIDLQEKCNGENKTCMVKRYSYSTSSTMVNSSYVHLMKMWSLERSCTNRCEDGCIIIGERTKLYACTSCCTTNLCNIGNSAHSYHEYSQLVLLLGIMVLFGIKNCTYLLQTHNSIK